MKATSGIAAALVAFVLVGCLASEALAAPLKFRDRVAITKAVNSYAGNAKSGARCWTFSDVTVLENGVKTVTVAGRRGAASKPECRTVEVLSERGIAKIDLRFSPGLGWQVVDDAARVYSAMRLNGHSLLPVGKGFGGSTPDQTVLGVYNGADGSPLEADNSETRGTYSVSTGDNLATTSDSGDGVQMAYAIPPTCNAAVFRVAGTFRTYSTTATFTLVAVASTFSGELARTAVPVMLDTSTRPAVGTFSVELPVAASDTLVKFSAGIDRSVSDEALMAHVEGNCYAIPTGENRITWSKVNPSRPAVLSNLQVRVYGRYTDGSWLPLAQGTRIFIGSRAATGLPPTAATYDWDPADTDLDLSYVSDPDGLVKMREVTLSQAASLIVTVPFGGHSVEVKRKGQTYSW